MTHRKPCLTTEITTAVLIMTAFALGIYAQSTTSSPENTPEKTLALKLIAAKTEDERSLLLANEVGLVNSNLVGALTDEAARQNGHAPYMELQRISRIGLTIAEQLGNKREIARALYSLGLTQQTDDEKRITFAKGLMISEEISDEEFIAKNLMRLAAFNNLDTQVEYYRRAIAMAEKIGDMRTTADALGGLGGVYRLKGDFVTARTYLSKSLAIMRQLNDPNGVANLISAIGVVSFRQGDLNTALEEYKKSLQIHESIGNKDGVSVDAFRIGNIYLAFGDNVQAMEWYLKSLKVGEEVGSGLGTFGATLNMVNVYNAQGNYQQARAYLKKVAGTTNENEYPWYALSGLAESYKVEGNYPEAIRFYLNLLARKEKEVNKDEIAETLIDIANCYLLIPDATKAEQYFERARTLSESTGHYLWRFQALIGIAKTQLIRKDFRGALDNANRAKAFIEKLKGTPELDLHTTLGRAYAGLGQPQPARIHFEKAISIVESLRTRVAGGSVEQQGDFQNKIIPYEMMADLMVSAGSNNEAFEIVEQAKARTLL
ncbi:MAG: tetratricopeptide repeat protein, partial [Acidobacteriota bacterium]